MKICRIPVKIQEKQGNSKILTNIKDLNLGVSGEEALWKAVIFQALTDATSESKKREDRYNKAAAISWLAGKSDDFKLVCSLAGFELNYIKPKIRHALTNKSRWKRKNAPIGEALNEK